VAGEIVVADNRSTDATARIARELGARVETVPLRGYGHALMAGIRSCRSPYVLFADADDSYDFGETGLYYEKLKAGCDFVVGNRFRGRIDPGAMPPLHRYLGTPVLTWLMNLFFRTGIGDVNCGMRAMTYAAFRRMRLRAGGMEFATEMIVKASRLKLKIAEVPCTLRVDKRDRRPHLRTWRDGWRHLRFMLLFTPTWTFLVPGFGIQATGLAGMLFILWRDLFRPDFALALSQKHILSALLLFILGEQVVAFGLIAKMFTFSKHFDRASRVVRFLYRYFSLEKGLLAGLGLTAAGAGGLIFLFLSYFGRWEPAIADTVRIDIAVFAMASVLTGVQTIFLSFVLSFFYLRVK